MNIKLGNLGQGVWRDLTEAELEGLFDLLKDSEKTAQPKKATSSSKKPNKPAETSSKSHPKGNPKDKGKPASSPKTGKTKTANNKFKSNKRT